MKKLITAMVAAATLAMSASAEDVCNYINDKNFLNILDKKVHKSFIDEAVFDSQKATPIQRAAFQSSADAVLNQKGLNSSIEISTAKGEKITYNAKNTIIKLNEFNNYLMNNNKNNIILKFYTFMFRLHPEEKYTSNLGNAVEEFRLFALKSFWIIDSFRTMNMNNIVDVFLDPVQFIPAVYINQSNFSSMIHIGHFDPEFQAFLHNVNINNFKVAAQIIEDNFSDAYFMEGAKIQCRN